MLENVNCREQRPWSWRRNRVRDAGAGVGLESRKSWEVMVQEQTKQGQRASLRLEQTSCCFPVLLEAPAPCLVGLNGRWRVKGKLDSVLGYLRGLEGHRGPEPVCGSNSWSPASSTDTYLFGHRGVHWGTSRMSRGAKMFTSSPSWTPLSQPSLHLFAPLPPHSRHTQSGPYWAHTLAPQTAPCLNSCQFLSSCFSAGGAPSPLS
jgi:hypothetical protein